MNSDFFDNRTEKRAVLGMGCVILVFYLAIWITLLVAAWLAIDKWLLT